LTLKFGTQANLDSFYPVLGFITGLKGELPRRMQAFLVHINVNQQRQYQSPPRQLATYEG
jgi:hypothetical protein